MSEHPPFPPWKYNYPSIGPPLPPKKMCGSAHVTEQFLVVLWRSLYISRVVTIIGVAYSALNLNIFLYRILYDFLINRSFLNKIDGKLTVLSMYIVHVSCAYIVQMNNSTECNNDAVFETLTFNGSCKSWIKTLVTVPIDSLILTYLFLSPMLVPFVHVTHTDFLI